MPQYKATVAFKDTNADQTQTVPITVEANNAIQAKVILQDQYGEASVKDIKRQGSLEMKLVDQKI